MNAALRLVNLTVSYDRHPAVHHVSAEIPAAEMTAIVGPNGAGKSTLLKALLGLAPHIEGRIETTAKRIAYLPQQAEIDRSFPISVFDTVLLGRWSRFGGFGAAKHVDIHDAQHAIEAVGLSGFERRPIDTLSVGQFQRVLFARLLLQDADLVLLDEPFAAINSKTVNDLMAVIQRWRAEQRTVVAVLHDLDQVRRDFPNALLMARELVDAGPTAQRAVGREPAARPRHGRGLGRARRRLRRADEAERLTAVAMLYEYLIAPFADFGFMRRALVASLALSVGGSAIGVFLILRRMSLMGDALAHSLLPGAALGFLLGGLSLPAMSLGGFLAGVATALISGVIARFSSMREDASFAAAYLTAMALGVLIVSLRGSAVDLMNILFGAILAVDEAALVLVVSTATLTLVGLAAIYRPLVVECFNPGFLAAMGIRGSVYHYLFLSLAVLNMVAGFQALGTLMALGLILLPAVAASFWAREVWSMTLVAAPMAFASALIGLLVSFHVGLPSGPVIVLFASLFFLGSLLLGSRASVRARLSHPVHLRG